MSGITTTSGSFQITSDVAEWNRRDTPGQSIMIAGAGVDSGTLVTKINRLFNSGSASLVDAASTTVAAAAFKHGQDEFRTFQALLTRAASSIEAPEARIIKLDPGVTVIDLSNETASLFLQNEVRIKGWGQEGSRIEVYGADHATLFKTSGSNVRVTLENVKINMNRAFFSGSLGTMAILIENAKSGKIENVAVVGASADAICISGSSGIVLQNIDTADVGNAVRIVDSTNVMLTNLTDSGSSGTGLKLENVQSSSFIGLALDDQGSGSFTQDSASAAGGNLVQGFVPFIDVQIPAPINNPTGSWIQFIEGGPNNPGGGTVQGALFANYEGMFDNNWLGIVGIQTGSNLLTDVKDLPAFFSISLQTGATNFSGSSFTVAQPINAAGGVTGSFTGSMDLQVGKMTGSILVDSGSTAIHELVDVGVQSSSFTMSFSDGNVKKFTAGNDVSIEFINLAAMQVVVVEIDNTGNHTVTLPSVLKWHLGTSELVTNGSNLLTLTQMSIGTFAQISNDIS